MAERGAIPATIAMVDGVAHVGLENDALERLVAASRPKLSAGELPVAMAQGASGGTTVAATALLASRAGIRVFATGGIGGVHRDATTTFDESADLGILGSCPITVVSGGVKSILDIGATLERLESLSVTVLVFGTNRFPAFWLADSGYTVDFWSPAPRRSRRSCRRPRRSPCRAGSWSPIPCRRPPSWTRRPRRPARQGTGRGRGGVGAGKEITPFLLDYIHEQTGAPAWRSTSRSCAATAGSAPTSPARGQRCRPVAFDPGPIGQRRAFAVRSSRSSASCRPSSMPELMWASRSS